MKLHQSGRRHGNRTQTLVLCSHRVLDQDDWTPRWTCPSPPSLLLLLLDPAISRIPPPTSLLLPPPHHICSRLRSQGLSVGNWALALEKVLPRTDLSWNRTQNLPLSPPHLLPFSRLLLLPDADLRSRETFTPRSPGNNLVGVSRVNAAPDLHTATPPFSGEAA